MSEVLEWTEIPKSEYGRQWVNKTSLNVLSNGNREILTKFSPANTKDNNQPLTIIYLMEIDCNNILFKDNEVNGSSNNEAKWISSNGDVLIKEVIDETCSISIT